MFKNSFHANLSQRKVKNSAHIMLSKDDSNITTFFELCELLLKNRCIYFVFKQ